MAAASAFCLELIGSVDVVHMERYGWLDEAVKVVLADEVDFARRRCDCWPEVSMTDHARRLIAAICQCRGSVTCDSVENVILQIL